jgi:hypothetical protein
MTTVSEDHRWEHGSFFDSRPLPVASGSDEAFRGAVLFGTGRGALGAAIEHGRQRGWQRLLVPTYYCHDVTRYIEPHVEVRMYEHGPTSAETVLRLDPGEVALVVEYFGARATVRVEGGEVLLDRTHDPLAAWTYERPPSMAFASLRKTLPLADGGALWPEADSALDEAPSSAEIEAASAAMNMAMDMKAKYLVGASDDKSAYLAEHAAAEQALTNASVGTMTSSSRAQLRSLPIRELQRRRRENLTVFRGALEVRTDALRHHDFPAFIVLSASGRVMRDRIREELRCRDIYSAVYWPLHGVEAGADEVDFSSRMLILHADHRYSPDDMVKVAAAVGDAVSDAHTKVRA